MIAIAVRAFFFPTRMGGAGCGIDYSARQQHAAGNDNSWVDQNVSSRVDQSLAGQALESKRDDRRRRNRGC